jgi:hypothetical protein
MRQAVAVTPDDQPDKVTLLANLSAILYLASNLITRYSQTRDSRAIDDAITLLERAIADTPAGSRARWPVEQSRGRTIREFLRTGELKPLDRAIELGRQACTAATLVQDPGRYGMLTQLALATAAAPRKRSHRRSPWGSGTEPRGGRDGARDRSRSAYVRRQGRYSDSGPVRQNQTTGTAQGIRRAGPGRTAGLASWPQR